MSVYVDPLSPCLRTVRWRWNRVSHLTGDSVLELHAFAHSIGLKRSWFQSGRMPHYDLTPGMRAKAVAHGAIEETRRESYQRRKRKCAE